jgi:hypothetical protein
MIMARNVTAISKPHSTAKSFSFPSHTLFYQKADWLVEFQSVQPAQTKNHTPWHKFQTIFVLDPPQVNPATENADPVAPQSTA